MPFIGNQPALSFTSFAKQDFTTSATTSYTLDNPVANANELALFINFVRQEPGSYSASGTQLTLTEATSSSDDMYCVYLGKAVQTVNPPNSSVGTSQLASSLDLSSKTITLASNMTNTPAFQAYLSSNQSISDNSDTKININTESFDTDNCYDNSSNYRFTPTTAGKYLFYANVVTSAGDDNNIAMDVKIYKNGSIGAELNYNAYVSSYAATLSSSGSIILEANGSSDYFELYAKSNDSSGTPTALGNSSYPKTYFGAYKLIGV